MKLAFAFAAALAIAGCTGRSAPLPSNPRYTIGPGYEALGVWHYPHEDFGYDRTGLASVIGDDAPPVTADGEGYDPTALTGASPTLQLPCIVLVTNLQNGRQLLVRVNDRGPIDPGRILAVTPRVADLLLIPAGPGGSAEVRVTVQQGPSQALADSLGGGIKMAAAPVTGFQSASLAPPPGVAQAGGGAIGATSSVTETAAAQAVPPLDLPVTLTQVPPEPGGLYIQSGSYGRRTDAQRAAARLYGLPNSQIIAISGEGRTLYGVMTGPYPDVPQADAALQSTFRAGGVDATIVVR
jgi:rare lipoprotein A